VKVLSVNNREELDQRMRDGNHLVVLFDSDPTLIPQITELVDRVTSQLSNYDGWLVDVHHHQKLAADLHVNSTVNYAVYQHGRLVKKLLIPDPSVDLLKSFLMNVTECVYG
jgi:hypothetical protein